MKTGTRYFLIRIPKTKQSYNRANVGSLFMHPNLVFFARNMQCGEIVAIGDIAQKGFPAAKVGMILIVHHFVEGSLDTRSTRTSLVTEDEHFRYYTVSGVEWAGTRVQAYGVFDGKKIIPHKDYIFLEVDQPKEIIKHSSFIMPEYTESTERTLGDLKKIKNEALRLSKNKMNNDLKEAIEKKDRRREQITLNFHKKEYQRYIVAYSSEDMHEVFALNVACNTIVTFLEKDYRVAETKYIAMYN